MPEVDDLLTSAEASTLAGCDRSTLSRRVTSGLLVPARKLGGRTGAYLFRRADIEALRDELQNEDVAS